MKRPRERTIVIAAQMNGIEYAFGVDLDDFDDPNKLEGAINHLAACIICALADKTDVFNEADFYIRRNDPDRYFKMIAERDAIAKKKWDAII